MNMCIDFTLKAFCGKILKYMLSHDDDDDDDAEVICVFYNKHNFALLFKTSDEYGHFIIQVTKLFLLIIKYADMKRVSQGEFETNS